MGFLNSSQGEDREDDEQDREPPCREVGHDFGEAEVYGYYANGIPHFTFCESWQVTKRLIYTCRKCGKVDFENVEVGKIHVDKETDVLTVTQNETSK